MFFVVDAFDIFALIFFNCFSYKKLKQIKIFFYCYKFRDQKLISLKSENVVENVFRLVSLSLEKVQSDFCSLKWFCDLILQFPSKNSCKINTFENIRPQASDKNENPETYRKVWRNFHKKNFAFQNSKALWA